MQIHTRPPICVGIFARTQCDSRLTSILKDFEAVYTTSWRELEAKLASGVCQTVLIDPLLLTSRDQQNMAAFRLAHPDAAFIAYASLDGASLHAIARVIRDGNIFHHVLIRERDCARYTLWRAIESASAHGLVNQVLGQFERDLSGLPEAVARTIVDLFAHPGRYSDVNDLASESAVRVHTLYRNFRSAHLGSPKKFLTLAKLCRAYFILRHSDASVREVASQLGYQRARTLTENCGHVLGCTPSSLRNAVNQDELALGLMDWLCKPHRRRRPKSVGGSNQRLRYTRLR